MSSAADVATAGVPVVARVADPARLRRVLLVKLSSLGDVVHALPLAESLRAGLGPDAHLAWAVQERFAGLLDGNPHLNATYILQKKRLGPVLSLGSRLRADGFDAALDTQGLLVSGLVTRLSGAPLRIGLDRNREGNALLMTHPVVRARHRGHIVEKLLGFCDALGVPRLPARPQRYLADAEADTAATLLAGADADGPVVGCIVGASTAEKAWPVERWSELARLLADKGARVVLLGGPGEVETARAIVGQTKGAVATDLTGKTPLRVLAAILARCQVVVGGDSGPTHLAVAVGTPVVGLYGVTDPAMTGPCWGPAPAVVLDYAEADAPPALRRPRRPTLPDALARIPASAAAEAALSLLG